MTFDPSIIDAANKIKLTLDSSAISSDQIDFPLTIVLDGADSLHAALFADLGANSKKISIESGATQLPVEIEYWDDVSEKAVLHTKVPTYTSSADAELVLSYDSTQVDNTNVGDIGDTISQSVWDSNFVAVYHMSQDPSVGGACVLDSTVNANHGTPTGLTLNADGKGYGFGAGKKVQIPASTSLNATTLTLETLCYPTTPTGEGVVIAKKETAWDQAAGWYLDRRSVNNNWLFLNSGTAYLDIDCGVTLNTNTLITATHSGSQVELFRDAISKGTASAPAITSNNDPLIFGGLKSSIATPYYGDINEVRISNITRSNDWINLTNLSLTDQLVSFSAYSSVFKVIYPLEQYYDLQNAYMTSILEQSYMLTDKIVALLDAVYGLRLARLFTQRWGDSGTIIAKFDSWYGSAPLHRRVLLQLYGNPVALRGKLGQVYRNALQLLATMEQPYHVASALLSLIDQIYHVSLGAVQASLAEGYSLAEYDALLAKLDQIYVALSEGSLVMHTLAVTVGGRNIRSFISVDIEASRDSYFLSCTIELADYGEYLQIAAGDAALISHNGQDYQFVVEQKARTRDTGSSSYRLELASPAILLESPYGLPMTAEYPAGMAAALAQQIVTECTDQVTLDWQLVNWPLPKNTLYATDETPLSVLRRLVAAVGGILQSFPDGSLVAMPAYPVDIDKLSDGPIAAYYTDTDNIFTVQDDPDPREGYNSYLVSDGTLGESGHTLSETTLTSKTKYVDGYIVPWVESGVSLDTSGGAEVSVEPLGVHTETIEEQVEIVRGEGRTSKPVYTMLDRSYHERSLGAISYSEDGSLSTEVAGESLVVVTYQTKYHRWIVTSNRVEDVQCILQTED